MDNKEFAKLLLCEATNLLEGAQKDAYVKRKQDKFDKDNKEKMDRYDRRYADRYSVGSKMHAKDTDTIEDILNPSTERAKYLSKQFKDDIQRNSDAHAMTRRKLGTTVSDLSYDWHQTKDASNRHLRKQSKKTQNESIAVLLTEAALLLNEGARYRKEMKDVNGKSSKDYGKQASKDIAQGKIGLTNMIDGAITNIDNKMILKDKENERLLKEILK